MMHGGNLQLSWFVYGSSNRIEGVLLAYGETKPKQTALVMRWHGK